MALDRTYGYRKRIFAVLSLVLFAVQIASAETLQTVLEWDFDTDQISSTPVLADIDADGIPEIAVNVSHMDGGGSTSGNIVVLNGQTGAEELRVPHIPESNQYGSHARSTIAVGDVDGDDVPDIIYASRVLSGGQSLVVAVDASGALLWTSHGADGSDYLFTIHNAAIAVANLDDDDQAEVVIGATLIDHDGLVIWDQGSDGNGSLYGSNANYLGGISAIADLNGDDIPEIISGRNAWTLDGGSFWVYVGDDGYPAVADLDSNGFPEVILVANSQIAVLNGLTGQLWCGIDPTEALCSDPAQRTQPIEIPGGVRGGPPTVADIDADGRPEIAVAGSSMFTVFDFNRTGEDIVQPGGDPPPSPGAIYVRWSSPIQDLSSGVTGSSAFDFDGDGVAELLHADECHLRVYSGTDGAVVLQLENSSLTSVEYPLVADIDADKKSEIIVVANGATAGMCSMPGYSGNRQGLYTYRAADVEWAPTRQVWTQHGYHVTNTDNKGNPPSLEQDNWLTSGLNNYRQSCYFETIFSDGFE
jgi:hypothetical protein